MRLSSRKTEQTPRSYVTQAQNIDSKQYIRQKNIVVGIK